MIINPEKFLWNWVTVSLFGQFKGQLGDRRRTRVPARASSFSKINICDCMSVRKGRTFARTCQIIAHMITFFRWCLKKFLVENKDESYKVFKKKCFTWFDDGDGGPYSAVTLRNWSDGKMRETISLQTPGVWEWDVHILTPVSAPSAHQIRWNGAGLGSAPLSKLSLLSYRKNKWFQLRHSKWNRHSLRWFSPQSFKSLFDQFYWLYKTESHDEFWKLFSNPSLMGNKFYSMESVFGR